MMKFTVLNNMGLAYIDTFQKTPHKLHLFFLAKTRAQNKKYYFSFYFEHGFFWPKCFYFYYELFFLVNNNRSFSDSCGSALGKSI